jgi:hypothetical protein
MVRRGKNWLFCFALSAQAAAAQPLAPSTLTLDSLIRLKFGSSGADLSAIRTEIVNASIISARRRYAADIGDDQATSVVAIARGFNCYRAHAEGRVAAMIVAVNEATSPTQARTNWTFVNATARRAEDAYRAAFRERLAAPSRVTPLGRALDVRVWRDQALRSAFENTTGPVALRNAARSVFWSRICRSDNDNARWLFSFIRRHGWPTITGYGERIANEAWLIAQHADTNPSFQSYALSLMEPLVARREADGIAYANLFDRVAVNAGRPQRFGTQIDFDRNANCVSAGPLEAPAEVDSRRSSVGLPPLRQELNEAAQTAGATLCAVDRVRW